MKAANDEGDPILYGTSYTGGGGSIGEVFALLPQPDGSFTFNPLYDFNGQFGGGPAPYLVQVGSTIYGTTGFYGGNGDGTLFSINPNGSGIQAPFNFGTGAEYPNSLIVGPDGNFYFSAYTDSSLTSVAFDQISFGGGPPPVLNPVHAFPFAGFPPRPVAIPGPFFNHGPPAQAQAAGFNGNNNVPIVTLFGVTSSGGAHSNGMVFAVNGDGTGFTNIYSFGATNNDGIRPYGGLALAGNTLYGTTSQGGSNFNGTIFKINLDGSGYGVLWHFSANGFNSLGETNSDGAFPEGDLVVSGNTIYGTTYDAGPNGGGTVFSINTNGGNFTMLHGFGLPQSDGQGNYTNSGGGYLQMGVLVSGNKLFGTTPQGGSHGGGVAFEIILPSPPQLRLAQTAGHLAISWPSAATNFVLQQNVTVNSLTWSNYTGGFTDDGTNKSANIVPAAGKAFFRLMSTNGL